VRPSGIGCDASVVGTTSLNELAINDLAADLMAPGRRLIILAGAGLSMAAPTEFDGGAELARRVVRSIRAEIPDFPNIDDPGLVFDALIARDPDGGAAKFVAIIQAVGPEYYPANAGHAALIKLYLEDVIQNIYSLNVDPQLEQCSTRLILNAGWTDANDIGGTARTHSLALRWSERGVAGTNLPPRLHKLHGCILRDAESTIWSAALLTSNDWPTGARWAQTGFESDIQHFPLLIVGCGFPVTYINRSIDRGKNFAASRKPSYLVSIESYANYVTNRNPDLVQVAGVRENTFFDVSASVFLESLHAAFIRKLLDGAKAELRGQIEDIAEVSAEHSVFVDEQAPLLDHITQIADAFKGNLDLLEKFLKKSLLWGRDLSLPQITEYYVPLRSNRLSVNDLIKAVALLRLSLGACVLDEKQVMFSMSLPNGRPIIAVHCRGLLPQAIIDKIFGTLLGLQGPVLPQTLTLLLLNTQASTQDLISLPPRNRTRPGGVLNRTNVSANRPDTWKLATGGDTVERAAYLPSAEWKTLMAERIG
jgi:hypothetical protein